MARPHPPVFTAKGLLEQAICLLEQAAKEGSSQVFALEKAVDVATLLDAPDLAARAWTVLDRTPPKNWLASAITNITFDASRVLHRQLERPREILDEIYPPRIQADLEANLRNWDETSDKHIRLCAQGNVEEAVKAATKAVEREGICLTLAVLGYIDEALELADRLELEPFRCRDLKVIACIELVRVSRSQEAEALFATLTLDAYGYLELALGLANRLSCNTYPFPDY